MSLRHYRNLLKDMLVSDLTVGETESLKLEVQKEKRLRDELPSLNTSLFLLRATLLMPWESTKEEERRIEARKNEIKGHLE